MTKKIITPGPRPRVNLNAFERRDAQGRPLRSFFTLEEIYEMDPSERPFGPMGLPLRMLDVGDISPVMCYNSQFPSTTNPVVNNAAINNIANNTNTVFAFNAANSYIATNNYNIVNNNNTVFDFNTANNYNTTNNYNMVVNHNLGYNFNSPNNTYFGQSHNTANNYNVANNNNFGNNFNIANYNNMAMAPTVVPIPNITVVGANLTANQGLPTYVPYSQNPGSVSYPAYNPGAGNNSAPSVPAPAPVPVIHVTAPGSPSPATHNTPRTTPSTTPPISHTNGNRSSSEQSKKRSRTELEAGEVEEAAPNVKRQCQNQVASEPQAEEEPTNEVPEPHPQATIPELKDSSLNKADGDNVNSNNVENNNSDDNADTIESPASEEQQESSIAVGASLYEDGLFTEQELDEISNFNLLIRFTYGPEDQPPVPDEA